VHILFDKLFATFQVETKKADQLPESASVSRFPCLPYFPNLFQFQSQSQSQAPSKAKALTLAAIPALIPQMGARGVTNMAAALPDAARQNL